MRSDRFGRSLRGLPGAFWWLWAATLITFIGGFVVPFLTIYLTEVRGYSVTFAGLALTVYGVGRAGASLAGGILTDRVGRRFVLLSAQALMVAGMLELGFVAARIPLLLGCLLIGAGSSAGRPAQSAAISDVVDEADRPRAFALNYWAINLGFSVAAISAGFVFQIGYLPLFLINAGANLVTGVMLYLKVPETRPRPAADDPHPHEHRHRHRHRHPVVAARARIRWSTPFVSVLVTFFLISLVMQQSIVTLPLAMTRDGLSPTLYGAAMTTNGLVIALLQIPLSRLSGRLEPASALAIAALLIGAGTGLTALVHVAPGYWACVAVWSLGEIILWPTTLARVADLASAELHGRYQGWLNVAWTVGAALAPSASGQAIQRWGTGVVWLGCLGLGLVCALIHIVFTGSGAEPGPAVTVAVPAHVGEPSEP